MAENGRDQTTRIRSRQEAAAIRRYLEALASKPRGRPVTADSLHRRIHTVQERIADEPNPLTRVGLYQRIIDTENQLASLDTRPDSAALEDGFVSHARSYSQRKGISYQAWRVIGVPAAVLKRAGMNRRG